MKVLPPWHPDYSLNVRINDVSLMGQESAMPEFDITYVPHIVLKGCVIPRARPDPDARAFHATFQNDIRDISYMLLFAMK